jgi:two-component system phosphate regulon sensor histidine kinase PhoR
MTKQKNMYFLKLKIRESVFRKKIKYIFDKFFRVTEKNLASRVKGSGLGLSIVKHIMDAHDGKIIVKSSPGNGSSFRLLFPVNKT